MKLAHLLEEVASYAADANILPLPGEKWEKLKTQCRDGRPLMRRMRADKKLQRIRVIYDMTGKPNKKNMDVLKD